MELTDYLGALKRRWWILVLIPLLAVVIVAGLQLQKPPSYTSTATVAAPALVGGASSNQYSGSAGPKTFVANFQAVLTSSVIVQKVSDDLKIPKGKISSGLTSTEVGLSSVMQVTYTGTKKSEVAPVARDAARQSILFLFQTQVDVAKQPVTAAQQQLDSVNAQLAAFAKSAGTPVPDRDYQVLATEISQLEQTQAQASATNNAIEASNLAPEIAGKKAQLAQLAGVLSTFLDLKDKQTEANSVLNAVNQTYEQAKAQFAAADPNQVVTVTDATKVSVISAILPAAGVALGSALAFALGIVFLLEAARRRRRVDDTGVAPTGPATPSGTAVPAAPHSGAPAPPAPDAPHVVTPAAEPVTRPVAAPAAPLEPAAHHAAVPAEPVTEPVAAPAPEAITPQVVPASEAVVPQAVSPNPAPVTADVTPAVARRGRLLRRGIGEMRSSNSDRSGRLTTPGDTRQ